MPYDKKDTTAVNFQDSVNQGKATYQLTETPGSVKMKKNKALNEKLKSYNMPKKKTKASIAEKFNKLRSF